MSNPESGQSNTKPESGHSRASDYDQLKSWYLARLRKQALALHEKSLTPAGLIRADRDLIENLVLGAAAPGPAGRPSHPVQLPVTALVAVPALGFLVLFAIVLNAENGNIFASTVDLLQMIIGTLVLQGSDHHLLARIGDLSWMLPVIAYSLPCLGLVLIEPAGIFLSNKWKEVPPRTWLPRCFLSIVLIAVLAIIPCLVFQAVNSGSAENDMPWRIALCLSGWALIVFGAYSAYLNSAFFFPLKAVLGTLEEATGKKTGSQPYAVALQDLVQDLLKARNELANRETLIADVSPDLLFVLSPEEKVLCCNWTSQNLLGFLPEEMTGKALAEMLLPQELEAVRATLASAQSSKESGCFDCRLRTKKQNAVDMRCTVEFSATHNCFFVSGRDITDQKMLEKAKREFVSMLGHDIRVPLGSALLTVQALEDGIYGDLPEASEDMLSEIEISLKRLVKLLEELLEFEQLSAGKMRLDIASIDTSQIIGQALSELSGQAQDKKITIETSGDGVQIQGDSGKLLRVVVNLVSNAIKFSPAGSKIIVSTQRPRAGAVEIRVTDQGPGIAPEYRKLVFERYERIESTSQEEGRGLGLAIAKSIVESHGGLIGVESQPGQGSTFWLTLPLRPAVGPPGNQP